MNTRYHTVLLTFFCCTLFAASLLAQGWETTLSFPGPSDYLVAGLPLSDGGTLGAGFQTTSGSGRTGLIYRLNAYGEMMWELVIPNRMIQWYTGIIPCGDGTFMTGFIEFADPPGNVPTYLYFIKFNDAGELISEVDAFPQTEFVAQLDYIIPSPNGGALAFPILFGQGTSTKRYTVQLNCDGTYGYFNQFQGLVHTINRVDDLNGHLYLVGKEVIPFSSGKIAISKADYFGNLINTKIYDGGGTGETIVLENEDIVFVESDFDDLIFTRVDSSNVTVDEDLIYSGNDFSFSKWSKLNDGYLVILQEEATLPGQFDYPVAIRLDEQGNVLWTQAYNNRPADIVFYEFKEADDGSLFFYGSIDNEECYVVKADENGVVFGNSIAGTVTIDENADCAQDALDTAIPNWIITADNNGDIFTATTNADGTYAMSVDTGDYIVTCHFPGSYWGTCDNNIPTAVAAADSTYQVDYSIKKEVLCPEMTVDGTTPFVRPCFERPGSFYYCNNGTTVAEDAYLEITLDSMLSIASAQPMWDSQNGDSYIFQLGDVAPLSCGTIHVSFFLDCDAPVGDSYCIESHIFPDSLCMSNSPNWSGAFLKVSAQCGTEKVTFAIENIGTEAMGQSKSYIIVEDAVLGYPGEVDLDAAEEELIEMPANGSTYTIIAEQVDFAPGVSMPMLVVEGCGENDSGTYSTGFANQFPQDEAPGYYDIDCVVARSSYDPNAKQASPEGYGASHYVLPETPIEYQILFQNTGTDTAFTVVLRDTLDEWLDLTTIRPGASSHAYDFEVSEHRTLKFTFNNIMLPDSNVNVVGSNGFVSFKISPKNTTPLGTVIRNKAAIYFDFNEPIITNETFHTLDEDFITLVSSLNQHPSIEGIDVAIAPNPFREFTKIEIRNHSADSYQLELYDVQGKIILEKEFSGPSFLLKNEFLATGMFFYRITSEDGFLGTGKLIVE